jgi:hypothetical protein
MITHEYEVNFVLENCVIITMAYLPDESEEDHEKMAISQAEDRLAYDGLDLSKLNFQEITATKTGEYN